MPARLTILIVTALLHGVAFAQNAAPGSAARPTDGAIMPLTEDEALPPPGKGNMFSDEQLRFCVAQMVRVDSIRPLLDRYEREEVEFFNAVVADFNSRCASYRYKGMALDEAKAWLEENRAQIEAATRANYMKRFPRETKKAVKAPKKNAAPAPEPSIEPTITARATGESKPPSTPSKPAPTPAPATTASDPTNTKPKEAAVASTKPKEAAVAASKPEEPAVDSSRPKEAADAGSKPVPAAPPPPRSAAEDKATQQDSKPVAPSTTTTAASESSKPKPQAGPAETLKPRAATTPPSTARDEKPAASASKPSSTPPTPPAKPKEVATDTSTKPGNAAVPSTPAQTPHAAAEEQSTEAAKPAEPLISKPKEFPVAASDAAPASLPPSQTPAASAPTAPAAPSVSGDKAAKDKPPTAAATVPASPTTKPQADEHLTATQRDSGARKAAKPATSKPPRPLPSARKTESPPTQVAAAAQKPEAPAAGPDAALTRLTKEIQRVASQVLPQPAGASENNTDLTTQVEVRYAEGGWVRSIVVGESSGSSALDEQALALARATRFPDVPEELRTREFSVRFPVVFKAVR